MDNYYFYTANQGRGNVYPVVKNEEGQFMIYDMETKQPLPEFTTKLLHDLLIFESDQISRFEDRCTKVRVNSLGDLFAWLAKYNKISTEKTAAEDALCTAKDNLFAMLKEDTDMFPDNSPITYAETKVMGCTDIVYWNGEPVTNPETNNEFFTPEDAKEVFAKLKAEEVFAKLKDEHAEEIEKVLSDLQQKYVENQDDESDPMEDWSASNYIWEQADLLDDLIYEETNKLWEHSV